MQGVVVNLTGSRAGIATVPATVTVPARESCASFTIPTEELSYDRGVIVTESYYFNDHLGTPLLQTDASQAIVWRAEYEPYGTLHELRTGLGKHQPLRFPGQENDGASDLSYNVFRWYRSEWGRYAQADPIGLGDANVFAYSGGNPLRYTDPLGLYNIDNRINLKPSSSPSASCGSPFACSLVAATVYYNCHCDPSVGQIVADATLLLIGTIYHFNGPFGSIKKKTRRSDSC